MRELPDKPKLTELEKVTLELHYAESLLRRAAAHIEYNNAENSKPICDDINKFLSYEEDHATE